MIPKLSFAPLCLLVIFHCRSFAQQIIPPNSVPGQPFVPRLLRQSLQPPPVTSVRPQQQVAPANVQRRQLAVLRPGFAWISRRKLEALQHSAEGGRPGGDHERSDLRQLEDRRRQRLFLRKLIDPAVEEAVSDPSFATRSRPADLPPQPPPAFRTPPQTQFRPPLAVPQARPQRPSQPGPRLQPAVTVLTAKQSPIGSQNRPPQPQAPPPQARPTPAPALPPPNQRLRAPQPQQFIPQNVNSAVGIDRRPGIAPQIPFKPPSPQPPPPPQAVQVAPSRQLQRSESPRTQPQAPPAPPRRPPPSSQQRPLQPTPPPTRAPPPSPTQPRPTVTTTAPPIQLSQSADQISRNSVLLNSPSPSVESQPKPAAVKTGPHPPGFLPPSNSVIEQLNSADNFMDVAERLQLKRLLINRSRRHTEFVVRQQQIMIASTPAPLVPRVIIGPEIPEKFSSIPVKNISKTVWKMPLTMTLQQKLTIMPKDKEKLVL